MFDALPEAFGSYRVVEGVGPGRFGPVYRAQDRTGLFVAIKVFDQGLTLDQAAAVAASLERLRDAPLNHPGIVPILAAGVAEDRPWLAEPWFDAEPLDAVMQRDELMPPGDVLVWVTQAAGALDFAAAVGIFHGALHPRDILVATGQTVIMGIGVIQALSDAGLAVPMEGAYVSPQRAAGHPLTQADDVFSLAAISYELVYGVPVPARSELRSTTAIPRGIQARRFLDVVEQALAREPADRPLSALRLAAAIQETVIPVSIPDSAPAIPTRDADPPIPIRDSAIPLRESDSSIPIRGSDSAILFRDADPVIPIRGSGSETPVQGFDFDPESTILIRDSHAPSHPVPAVEPVPEVRIRASEPPTKAADLPLRSSEPEARKRNQHLKRDEHRESASESAIWFPLSATLAIGLLMGFASGYVAGQRDATPVPHAAERPVAREETAAGTRRGDETPTPTGGRDFSESVVPTPQGTDRPASPAPEADAGARTNAAAAGQPGVLQVDSRPRGAQVFVDGRLVGTTPVVLTNVPPGAHAVRIDLRGHRRWVTSVDVAPGERHRVAASLER